jgi:hypothetical protein
MSKRHGKLYIQRKAKRIELPKGPQHQSLFHFEVEIDGDEIKAVKQVPDWPFDTSEDNSSLLSMTQFGVALQTTWRPFKPEPGSELRYKGYLAIVDDIGSRDPALAKEFAQVDWGFGHPEDATVEWHKPQGDDA